MGQVLAVPGNAAPGFERAAAAFIDAHTAGPGAWTGGTAKKYRETFAALTLRLRGSAGEHLAALDTEPGRVSLKTAFADAFDHLAPATYARHLLALRSAIRWWKDANWITGDPTAGWARPKVPVDKTRALSRSQTEALFRLDGPLREKTLWRLAYESAARAEEILSLDVDDLDLPNKRARVISKGGAIEWIHCRRAPRCCCCRGCWPAAPKGRCSSPTADPPGRSPPWTCARSPSGQGSPTGARPRSSSR